MIRWMRATAPLLCALLLPGGCRSATGFDVDGLRIYGVDGANNLIEFGSRSPDQVRRREITGLQPDEVLLGLDFLYVVDASTTIATPLGGPFATPLAGEAFGVDFDPGSGQLRVVGSGGQNLRVDPGGAGAADAALTFAPGDPGAITTPRVTAVAFSAGSPPALYAIDSNRDALLALPTPASGVAATIGALGINISDDAAFDIVDTREGERAYAVLSEERVSRLYRIDLATGAPRLIGRLASRSAVRAMAVVPDPDERP
jgi:hypothetical protein